MNNLQTYQFQTVTIHLDSSKTEEQGSLTLENQDGEAKYFQIDLGTDVTLEMVCIPEGNFIMGTPEKELGRSSDENPQHQVTVAPFFMSKYPITQAQYLAVINNNPSIFKGNNKPVESVCWFDCIEFCQKLSDLTGRKFRLPSEAEWEYACRAGTTTPFYFGKTLTIDLANYKGQFAYGNGPSGIYRQETTDVGSFPPNAFGLYDLHGNVWEWCADSWHDNYAQAPPDSRVWEEEENEDKQLPRVLRGGSWDDTAYYCRSGVRLWTSPEVQGKLIGFRVVC
jgi:formylglycine-generating enzyme required for sulfatase activity